ncbi:MAG: hypothetical protein A2749_01630 [Parcubacteria group bacterium RIFCSPHIGHO2_01_FULL_45_26]|nr:MAG: hypothetical protein A2749_01630 [Parcubacteria group bacterium RIFCSPHIGHO2_01_FULL_45_26]
MDRDLTHLDTRRAQAARLTFRLSTSTLRVSVKQTWKFFIQRPYNFPFLNPRDITSKIEEREREAKRLASRLSQISLDGSLEHCQAEGCEAKPSRREDFSSKGTDEA